MKGYVRLELRRMWRSPSFLLYTVFLPLAFYLLFTNVTSLSQQDRRLASLYVMISIGAYSAIGAGLNYGATLINDRSTGWLRQLRLTPIRPAAVVSGKVATGTLLGLPPIVVLCLSAAVINQVRLGPAQWLAVVVLLWVGSIPFAVLGIGLGYACRSETAQAVNFLIYFGMAAMGGLWFPLSILPAWLQAVGRLTPAHAYADLSRRVASMHDSTIPTDLATLGAWFLVFGLFAAHAYRRSSARRGS